MLAPTALLICLLLLAFVPALVGYCRQLAAWQMMRIWLWLALPVLGWLVALWLAIDGDTSPH